MFVRALVVFTYSHIYENYRVWDLPWDWVGTWLLAALGADFAYYWIHRVAHGGIPYFFTCGEAAGPRP